MKKYLVAVTALMMFCWCTSLLAQQSLGGWYNSQKVKNTEINPEFLKLEIPRTASLSERNEEVLEENQDPTPLMVQTNQNTYQIGDVFSLQLLSRKDGYVYIHNLVPDQKAVLIFPTNGSHDNQVEANEIYSYPRAGSSFIWRIGQNSTGERLLITLASKPLTDEQIALVAQMPNRLGNEIEGKIQINQLRIELPVGDVPELQPTVPETDSTSKKRIAILVSYLLMKAEDKYYESGIYSFAGGSFIQMLNTLIVSKEFDEIYPVAGPNMNKKYFTNLLKMLAANTSKGDEIFLYVNTHGVTGPECLPDSSNVEPSGGHEALIFTEGAPMSDDEFSDLLLELKHCRVMLLLETCHSGGFLSPETLSREININRSFFEGPKAVKDPEQFLQDLLRLASLSYDSDSFMKAVPSMLAGTKFQKTPEGQKNAGEVPHTSGGITLREFMRNQKSLGDSETSNGFVASLTKNLGACSKDITKDHPNIAIITTCGYDELSWCCSTNDKYQWFGFDIQNEKWVFRPIEDYSTFNITPGAFAFRLAMLDTTGKYTSDPHKASFDDVWNLLKEFIPVNNTRMNEKAEDAYKNRSQTPCYFNTAGEMMLRNSK